jgi:hypothetical protein
LTKRQVDDNCQNATLAKCQVDDTASWLMKQKVDEKAS